MGGMAMFKTTKAGQRLIRIASEKRSEVKRTNRDKGCEVKRLLQQGVDPNATGEDGIPALTHAVRRGHVSTTLELLEAGADPRLQDNDGKTPLHHCMNPEIAAALITFGARGSEQDKRDISALDHHMYYPVVGSPLIATIITTLSLCGLGKDGLLRHPRRVRHPGTRKMLQLD